MIKRREQQILKQEQQESFSIPNTTRDLLELLDKWYDDSYETNSEKVGTPEYWKKAGVIELKNKLKHILKNKT